MAIGKHSSKLSGIAAAGAAILLLSANIPAYAIFIPSGGSASIERFTGIWGDEEQSEPAVDSKLSYSPVLLLSVARIIGRFRGATGGYVTDKDVLEEELSLVNKKSGNHHLALPPILNPEQNLRAETPQPKDPFILDLPSISVDESPATGTRQLDYPPTIASALPLVRPPISNPPPQTNIDNSFMLWTLQPRTTGGDNGWNNDSEEPYKGTFIECMPGTRIKSMVADRLVVESGRLLVSNRGSVLKIVTGSTEVVIPSGSSLILDCTAENLRLTALECTSAHRITISRGGTLLAQLNPGDEASVVGQGQPTMNKVSVSQLLSTDQLLRGDNKLETVQKSALAELKSHLIDQRQVSK